MKTAKRALRRVITVRGAAVRGAPVTGAVNVCCEPVMCVEGVLSHHCHTSEGYTRDYISSYKCMNVCCNLVKGTSHRACHMNVCSSRLGSR